MDAKTKHVVIIAGPGDETFGLQKVKDVETAFKEAGAKVTLIGDDTRDVTPEEMVISLAEIREPMTIFLLAHGTEKDGKHFFSLGDEYGFPAEDLFKAIKIITEGQRVDCFMASCHSEAAQDSARKILPTGSVLAGFSSTYDRRVDNFDVDSFITTINKNVSDNFSADQLLLNYLMNATHVILIP